MRSGDVESMQKRRSITLGLQEVLRLQRNGRHLTGLSDESRMIFIVS